MPRLPRASSRYPFIVRNYENWESTSTLRTSLTISRISGGTRDYESYARFKVTLLSLDVFRMLVSPSQPDFKMVAGGLIDIFPSLKLYDGLA